ncbi:translation elongation factor Ts [Entomospira entomophila]|uniref:Elongation factor Ts n=1 Tax=Entomospira entomophila TaxID=2719988 RepID=A0A968KRL5_9SPIO|nr:translation elongation factor Ts [Entomospira entomophilus]NIZ40873.1 translation elongation factor Ts [Entomospira entomophilus]WDI35085.1 translation elongation factor Ts [Entomospira entomophilus]
MSVSITPAMVKELRLKTDAGMSDCKKALQDADGDFEGAIKLLKERGLAAANKRGERITAEGNIFIKIDDKKATAIELKCETDFVALTDQFREVGNTIVALAHAAGANEVTDELKQPAMEAVAVLKENLVLRRVQTFVLDENEVAAGYVHTGMPMGSVVKAKVEGCDKNDSRIQTLLSDCAMHIVASNPLYLNVDAIDAEYIKNQKEIFVKQTLELGKPENIAQSIAEGKLKSHLAEVSFLDQEFVKEPKVTVAQVTERLAKELGCKISITGFMNFRVSI